jgi:predicted ATPase
MTPEPEKASAGEAVPDDVLSLEAILDRFNGDSRAALEAALSDIAFLRKELHFASLAMSYGFARGWTPCTERGDAKRL